MYPRTDVIISTIKPPANNRAASEVKKKSPKEMKNLFL